MTVRLCPLSVAISEYVSVEKTRITAVVGVVALQVLAICRPECDAEMAIISEGWA